MEYYSAKKKKKKKGKNNLRLLEQIVHRYIDVNDSDNEVSGRKEEHGRENTHHLREWLNCHEADVNMSMFTRGVAGAFQRERRNNY